MRAVIKNRLILIDEEDKDLLEKFKWYELEKRFYTEKDGQKAFLHRVIAKRKLNKYLSGKYNVVFKNGDIWNYKRNNLLFQTQGLTTEKREKLPGIIYNEHSKEYEVVVHLGSFDTKEEAEKYYAFFHDKVVKNVKDIIL